MLVQHCGSQVNPVLPEARRPGMSDYEDIDYAVTDTTAIITINRPHRYNAFRGKTVEEMVKAFRKAWADKGVRAVILTGAGEKAFCTGGDVKQRAETGDYGRSEEHTSELQSREKLVCRLLLEKKKN